MRTEEANRLEDELDSLSLNSYKANLVESIALLTETGLKAKGKKSQKPNHHRQRNKFSNKIQKPKGLSNVNGKRRPKTYQCLFRKGQY